MRCAIALMVVALTLSGCAADVAPSVSDQTAELGDWQFRYNEAREEVTATRGDAELRYPLREMGPQGEELLAVFKGHDGAAWTIPAGGDGADATESGEAIGQTEDPYVIIGPPPRVVTPPVYGAGSHPPGGGGYAGHGRPPGIDRATWGRMCLYASIVGAGLTCTAAGLSCGAGTFMTVGGLAIPCTLIVGIACATTAGAYTLAALDCPSTARGK